MLRWHKQGLLSRAEVEDDFAWVRHRNLEQMERPEAETFKTRLCELLRLHHSGQEYPFDIICYASRHLLRLHQRFELLTSQLADELVPEVVFPLVAKYARFNLSLDPLIELDQQFMFCSLDDLISETAIANTRERIYPYRYLAWLLYHLVLQQVGRNLESAKLLPYLLLLHTEVHTPLRPDRPAIRKPGEVLAAMTLLWMLYLPRERPPKYLEELMRDFMIPLLKKSATLQTRIFFIMSGHFDDRVIDRLLRFLIFHPDRLHPQMEKCIMWALAQQKIKWTHYLDDELEQLFTRPLACQANIWAWRLFHRLIKVSRRVKYDSSFDGIEDRDDWLFKQFKMGTIMLHHLLIADPLSFYNQNELPKILLCCEHFTKMQFADNWLKEVLMYWPPQVAHESWVTKFIQLIYWGLRAEPVVTEADDIREKLRQRRLRLALMAAFKLNFDLTLRMGNQAMSGLNEEQDAWFWRYLDQFLDILFTEELNEDILEGFYDDISIEYEPQSELENFTNLMVSVYGIININSKLARNVRYAPFKPRMREAQFQLSELIEERLPTHREGTNERVMLQDARDRLVVMNFNPHQIPN